ncbi:MAG: hypothetical protein K6F27_05670 [Ruminococcus sp.]|nr:hypothetical protein [Ruminococcus sp.]
MDNIIDARTENLDVDAMDTDNIFEGGDDPSDEINERIKELLDKMDSDRITDIADLHLSCADEYHNEGVEAARARDYQKACDIVVKGNKEFPGCVDLIADCIHYSSLCFRDDIAVEYYKRLRQLPLKCYNWRAFSFAIDFLMKDYNKNENEIRKVIEEYKCNIPYEERALESEAELEEKLGNVDKAIDILTEAINRFPNASQCAIKLLEYQLDKGLYADAIKTARYGMSCIETQPSVNLPYFALCECLILDHFLHLKANKGEKISKQEIITLSEKYQTLSSKFKCDLRHYRSVIEMRRNLLAFIDTMDDDEEDTIKISENVEKGSEL